MICDETNDDADILKNGNKNIEGVIINEIQLILAEKRTSLAVMRTGIAVLALPLSVMGLLIATSKYYDIINVIHLFIPLMVLCALLVSLGLFLVSRSILKMFHYDKLIKCLKRKNTTVSEIVD